MEILKQFDQDKPVRVYRNLHKQCYSVQQKGRVVAHTETLCLRDVQFIVQPAGRDRVRREGRKNVHAFSKGIIVPGVEWLKNPRKAMYNPYKFDTFVDGMTWKPVFFADIVYLSEIGVIYGRSD